MGTLTLRREFEAQARGLWSSVAAALGAGCRADAAALRAFTAAAALALRDGAAPRTARDLADLSAQQQALQLKMPEVFLLLLLLLVVPHFPPNKPLTTN